MLEWSRAETGVGPSIAAGSHGWSPNWADFPMAARINPISGRIDSLSNKINICWSCQEFTLIDKYAILKIRPMSPTRLYITACMAAVLASARACHQLINKNDIIPTPSHPINS